MAAVNVARVIDPRIDTRRDTAFLAYMGAQNWENYRISASGLSNDSITFANITSLGEGRIYQDNFAVEYKASITVSATSSTAGPTAGKENKVLNAGDFCFRPFPLMMCSNQVAVNINGRRCESRPRDTLNARMQHWPRHLLNRVAMNCPTMKASTISSYYKIPIYASQANPIGELGGYCPTAACDDPRIQGRVSIDGTSGNDVKVLNLVNPNCAAAGQTAVATFDVIIREPLLCPPFNSNIFAAYGKPLWNISSIDITIWLENLHRMLFGLGAVVVSTDKLANPAETDFATRTVSVNLTSAQLCFSVANIREPVPPQCTLMYQELTPYITEFPNVVTPLQSFSVTSGVYTLPYMPNSIYVFVARSLSQYNNQLVTQESFATAAIDHVNVTFGNNTQLLNTRLPADLYNIALANGNELGFKQWAGELHQFIPQTGAGQQPSFASAGVLRMKPGIDLAIPSELVVPGAPADKLVFQITVDARDIKGSFGQSNRNVLNLYSLYVLFEYNGILTINPALADIDMIPIKTIEEAQAAPLIDIRTLEHAAWGDDAMGAGFWDAIKGFFGKIKDSGILGNIAKVIPGPIGLAAQGITGALGLGYPGGKRRRVMGAGVRAGAQVPPSFYTEN